MDVNDTRDFGVLCRGHRIIKAMKNVRWKRAEPSDQQVLLPLMKRYYACEGMTFEAEKHGGALENLLKNPSLGEVLLIFLNEDIAGYCVLTNGYSLEYGGLYQFLDELFITEDFRGRSLGTATLEYIERRGRETGVTSIHLEVDIENIAAQKLYQNREYASSGRYLWSKLLS